MGNFAPERWWLDVVHAVGFVLAPGSASRSRSRVAYLRGWLKFTEDPFWQTGLCRDLAQYSAESGERGGHDQALQWIIQAETAAQHLGDPAQVRLARHIQATTLLGLERYQEALHLLPQDVHPSIHQRVFEETNWIGTLLGLGERNAAHARLSGLYALTRDHGLSTQGPDGLARRFDTGAT